MAPQGKKIKTKDSALSPSNCSSDISTDDDSNDATFHVTSNKAGSVRRKKRATSPIPLVFPPQNQRVTRGMAKRLLENGVVTRNSELVVRPYERAKKARSIVSIVSSPKQLNIVNKYNIKRDLPKSSVMVPKVPNVNETIDLDSTIEDFEQDLESDPRKDKPESSVLIVNGREDTEINVIEKLAYDTTAAILQCHPNSLLPQITSISKRIPESELNFEDDIIENEELSEIHCRNRDSTSLQNAPISSSNSETTSVIRRSSSLYATPTGEGVLRPRCFDSTYTIRRAGYESVGSINISNLDLTENFVDPENEEPQVRDNYNITLFDEYDGDQFSHRTGKEHSKWAASGDCITEQAFLCRPDMYKFTSKHFKEEGDRVFPVADPKKTLFPNAKNPRNPRQH